MVCPQCQFSNAAGITHCAKCHAPVDNEGATVAFDPAEEVSALAASTGVAAGARQSGETGEAGWSVPQRRSETQPAVWARLAPGAVLADRYEILALLGEGGMGAVYKAKDRELDRLVALKVIRPELAGNPSILQRFKQELILARQVTHRNVIRIFDLGVAEGLKFITMEFLEATDLKTLLGEKKFSPKEAVEIIEQVCRGLEAAHKAHVVHRDLKPQNIMIDANRKVSLMDFGLAYSMEQQGGLTRTGVLMGTPHYMSPEQAKGQSVDSRSDLFTVGLIFYELLSGTLPFQCDTMMGTLWARIQQTATPIIEIDPTIPKALNDILIKCLATDVAQRYQSAGEMLADLEAWRGVTPAGVRAPQLPLTAEPTAWKWISAVLAGFLLIAATTFLVFQLFFKPAPKPRPLTMLAADIENNTGDPVFDSTLEPMFSLAMEGAPFLSLIARDQEYIQAELQSHAGKLDESSARTIAMRQGIDVVVGGVIARHGNGYEITIRAIDVLTGKTRASRNATVSSKQSIPVSIAKLTARVRKAFGDATPESVQLAAAAAFTPASLDAAHCYAVARDLELAGKFQEAIRQFAHAVELDPNLGRAYAQIATIHRNLGERQEAEKYYKEAMARIGRMNGREKYRTRAGYYEVTGDNQKAIQEFTALVKEYPGDVAGHAALAAAYGNARNMPKALEEELRAAEIYPKNASQRAGAALIALYAGDFDAAVREAREASRLNPKYEKPLVVLALSALAQGRAAEAAENYHHLQTISPLGASLAASGLADLAVYEGRISEAVVILEKGAAADLAGKNPGPAAHKLAALSRARLLLGQKSGAAEAADRASPATTDDSVLFLTARVYIELDQEGKARTLIAKLLQRSERAPQAYGKVLQGEALLKGGNSREAVRVFEDAQRLVDTWIGHFDLGRAYLAAEAFTEASSEFDLSLKRRGEATSLFLDEVATYSFLPPVYYYSGRAQEGLKSPGAAEAYKTYLGLKTKRDEDPLAPDASRRLGGA